MVCPASLTASNGFIFIKTFQVVSFWSNGQVCSSLSSTESNSLAKFYNICRNTLCGECNFAMFCHVLPLASSVIVEGRRFLESVWQWILVCLRAVSRSKKRKLEKVSRRQTLGGVLRRVTIGLESLINIILVFYYVLLCCTTMFHSVSLQFSAACNLL